MSLVEGGDFICYRHNFKTKDIEIWNNHCIKENHTISGVSPCINCNKPVEFKGLPFLKIGQKPPLVPHVKCEDCKND